MTVRTSSSAPDFGSVLETLSDALIIADNENTIVYSNQALTDLLGWKAEDIVGKKVADTLVPERLRSKHLAGFHRFIPTSGPAGIGQPIRLPGRAADGTEIDIELTFSLARSSAGSPLVVGALRDARERIELERHSALVAELLDVLAHPGSLQETTGRILRGICMTLDWHAGAIWMVDRQTDLLQCVQFWTHPSVNIPGFERFSRETAFRKGEGLPGYIWERGEAAWIEDMTAEERFPRRNLASEEGLRSAFGLPILNDGRTVGIAEFFSRRVLEPQEELIDTMKSIGDQLGHYLSERAEAEQLAFQKALLESQSEASIDGILVVSPRGEMIYFNRRFIDVWGIPEEVLESRSDRMAREAVLDQLVDPDSFLERVAYLYDHPKESSCDELHLKDGRIIERNSAPVRDGDGVYYGRVWFFRDISEQRRAVENLAAVAHVLQQSLLPPQLPDIPGVELAAMYRPGKEGSEVGGDFYDAFEVKGGEWAIVIGDVQGKGARAATLTAVARHTLQAAAALEPDPKKVASVVNDAFVREGSGRFCTLCYTRLRRDGDEVLATVSAAGHPPPFVLHPDGVVQAVPAQGDLLGVMETPELMPATVALRPGDALIFYTDGLSDLIDRRLPSAGSLPGILAELAGRKPSEIIGALEELADKATQFGYHDDIAVLAVRIPPGQQG